MNIALPEDTEAVMINPAQLIKLSFNLKKIIIILIWEAVRNPEIF